MLATKFSPEFTKIFQYLGNDLSILTLTPYKVREANTYSQSYNFTIDNNAFEILDQFLN